MQRNFLSTGGRAPGAFFYQTSSIPEFQKSSQTVYVRLFIVVVCPIIGQQTSASGGSTYPPGQGGKRITRDWQRFTPTSDARNQEYFLQFSKCAAIIPANGPARNGWDSRGYSKQSPLDFVWRLKFFTSSKVSADGLDKHGEQLSYMCFAFNNTRNDFEFYCPLTDKKIWHQSEARTTATFRTSQVKYCPQAFSPCFRLPLVLL